ncbi:MAG: LysR family transcriptional regulator [Clostridium butyricum]|nr:LysR family transcriptional regulator [Clostridium butyricum]
MDIKQLEYFIAAAELLNFTKAAKKFFISQTAISQQIKSLEETLNVQLFIRSNRTVSLTPAGKTFFKRAKKIVSDLNNAIDETTKSNLGYNGSLKIGFTRGHSPHILYKSTRKFMDMYPEVDIDIVDENVGALYDKLNSNTLDLIFSIDFNLKELKNFESIPIYSEPVYAIMNANHPLANSKKLLRSDLKNEKFVFIKREEAPNGYDNMISKCIKSGFSPNIVKHCNSLESLSLLIKLGVGVTLFPKFQLSDLTDSLKFIPIESDTELINHVLIWNNTNTNPAVNLFLNMLEIN